LTLSFTTVLVERLRQESNIINTAGEGFELVKAISDPNFELLIDFYHLASEKEDPAIILRAREHIRHLHMANPQGRVFPLKWEFDYAPFFCEPAPDWLRRPHQHRGLEPRHSDGSPAGHCPAAAGLH
jgi:sugar phosphate isomerase/epimerase